MPEVAPKAANASSEASELRERTWDKFRRWGYLAASLDPLGFLPRSAPPELDDTSPAAAEARVIY